MWDETLAMTYSIRSNKKVIRIQESRGAWSSKLNLDTKKRKDNIIDNWDKYFFEHNISYFFELNSIVKGKYQFESGLSCYDDCTMPITTELRSQLDYHPSTLSIMMLVPFDPDSENFSDVFSEAFRYAEQNNYTVYGDPWGHIGYRDEHRGVSTDYLALWLPVKLKDT
jgi:hypothetical protein